MARGIDEVGSACGYDLVSVSMSTLPNFIVGGAAASGTSFLTSAIIQHPQIYMPKPIVPECHFFYKSWEFEKGVDYYASYWFAKAAGEVAIGERSSSYLFGGANVARRIAEVVPEVKFIFTLRNPVERAWANYRFTALQGLDELDFMDALLREKERIAQAEGQWAEIQPHNYTGRGLYAEQLEGYLNHFPLENIMLIKSEAMSRDKHGTLKEVFRFLGVEEEFVPTIPKDFTSVDIISARAQARIRSHFGPRIIPILDAIRAGGDGMGLATSDADRDYIKKLHGNLCSRKAEMDAAARAYLKDYFREDLQRLRHLVPFDIHDWME